MGISCRYRAAYACASLRARGWFLHGRATVSVAHRHPERALPLSLSVARPVHRRRHLFPGCDESFFARDTSSFDSCIKLLTPPWWHAARDRPSVSHTLCTHTPRVPCPVRTPKGIISLLYFCKRFFSKSFCTPRSE